MWDELGISAGTAVLILISLYFVIKWAVKNGIKEAYGAITGKKAERHPKRNRPKRTWIGSRGSINPVSLSPKRPRFVLESNKRLFIHLG
mgnify:CR=1 FL=1